ncbi:hypothetical protein LC612_30115 [Nostoc sp. CHAB 5834]|nr:hypothetical protein [Nostoc sp. CHAB 5834]
MTLNAQTNAKPRERKQLVPPKDVTPGMNLFDYLRLCQPPVDRKIIDIACSEKGVPEGLREEAAQDIRLYWSTQIPDIETYKPGQIAAYAHRVAGHVALRTRRELGAPVRLPGSAFRRRKDGSSYVNPGVLSAALDWAEMEAWFLTGDNESAAPAGMSGIDASVAAGVNPEEEAVDPENSEEAQLRERLQLLESRKDMMTPRQYEIMHSFIEGATYEELMEEHQIKKGVMTREIAVAASMLATAFD